MMQYRLHLIILILVLTLFGCKQSKTSTEKPPEKMRITFQVIPEDHDRSLYYVEWKDTLGQSEGYLPGNILKRPREIWCIVTNPNNDTLGHYTGLSTAQTFSYFQSTDQVITLNFKIGMNIFSDKFDPTVTVSEFQTKYLLPVEFEPVNVNLKTDLGKKFNIELKEKRR